MAAISLYLLDTNVCIALLDATSPILEVRLATAIIGGQSLACLRSPRSSYGTASARAQN